MSGLVVFIGTKAQYIKTAPLLRLMDSQGTDYRLVDSGQHADLSATMRRDLGVREPDVSLGHGRDVESIPQAVAWSLGLAGLVWSRRKLQEDIFGGRGGICVIHGDTPSTLLSALMARRAGFRVAHLESGLRSRRLTHPFPEEMIRIIVMRVSSVLFAPDQTAVANLRRMRVRGRVVPLSANTSIEAVRYALQAKAGGEGSAIVTLHRVENLKVPKRFRGFVRLVLAIAADRPVRFVLHGPTREALEKSGLRPKLEAGNVELIDLMNHTDFVEILRDASLVVTDGGSIQEECALLGVPTLLWRDRSERPDGIGQNVVVSHYDRGTVDDFLRRFCEFRRPARSLDGDPSEEILEVLTGELRMR